MARPNPNHSEIMPTNNGLIVCGTDTNVGKTLISALLVQGLNGCYWKPIQSGKNEVTDTDQLRHILNLPEERIVPETYKFHAPVSPHWAAEREGLVVDPNKLRIPPSKRFLIVETAGGLMVPLNRKLLQIDQIKKWLLPVVLVARSGLGTLNHTLLSIEALRNREIPLLGILLNGPYHPDNPKTLEQIGNVPLIGELPHLNEISSASLDMEWNHRKIGPTLKNLLKKYI